MTDPARPANALTLAGGSFWFDRVEALERGKQPRMIAANEVPADVHAALTRRARPLPDWRWTGRG